MSVEANSAERRRVPGQINLVAWTYVILGSGLGIASLAGAEFGPFRLSAVDAIVPVLLIFGAIGAILRRPWGRWLCYVLSALLLPAVPLGTILGGFMIYYLTVYRDQFRRPRPSLN